MEALNRYEEHSLAGKRKIENSSEKNTRAAGSRARLSQPQNWGSREPLILSRI